MKITNEIKEFVSTTVNTKLDKLCRETKKKHDNEIAEIHKLYDSNFDKDAADLIKKYKDIISKNYPKYRCVSFKPQFIVEPLPEISIFNYYKDIKDKVLAEASINSDIKTTDDIEKLIDAEIKKFTAKISSDKNEKENK